MAFVEVPEGIVWPPPARPITGPLPIGSAVVFSGRCLLMGYSLGGGANGVGTDLFDGLDTSGQPSGHVSVPANSAVFPWFGDHGIYLERGLTVNNNVAVTSAVYFVAALWRPGNT